MKQMYLLNIATYGQVRRGLQIIQQEIKPKIFHMERR